MKDRPSKMNASTYKGEKKKVSGSSHIVWGL